MSSVRIRVVGRSKERKNGEERINGKVRKGSMEKGRKKGRKEGRNKGRKERKKV